MQLYFNVYINDLINNVEKTIRLIYILKIKLKFKLVSI